MSVERAVLPIGTPVSSVTIVGSLALITKAASVRGAARGGAVLGESFSDEFDQCKCQKGLAGRDRQVAGKSVVLGHPVEDLIGPIVERLGDYDCAFAS
ncbi:MAG: hypothetical protein V9F03_05555 [Microthrixaceae bacterium]